jgi:hypothetical protein
VEPGDDDAAAASDGSRAGGNDASGGSDATTAQGDGGSSGDASIGDGGSATTGEAGIALGAASTSYRLGTHPLVVDGTTIYVATSGATGVGVVAFPKDGGASRVVAAGGRVGDIAVDATSIYTVDNSFGSGAIRAPLDGGTAAVFAPTSSLAAPLMEPAHPFADATNLYFFDEEGSGIFAAPLAGGPVTQIAPAYANDLVLAGGALYAAEGSFVAKLSTAGTQIGTVPGAPMALTADAANVYWVEGSSTLGPVKMAPLGDFGDGGTNVATLAAAVGDNPGQMVVDGQSVYLLNMGNFSYGSVVKIPIAGGPPTTLFAASGGLFVGLGVDDDSVYFTYAGMLYRHAK